METPGLTKAADKAPIEELDESGEIDESGVEPKDVRALQGSQAQAHVTAPAPALWNVSLRLALLRLPRRAPAAARASRFTTYARHLTRSRVVQF